MIIKENRTHFVNGIANGEFFCVHKDIEQWKLIWDDESTRYNNNRLKKRK